MCNRLSFVDTPHPLHRFTENEMNLHRLLSDTTRSEFYSHVKITLVSVSLFLDYLNIRGTDQSCRYGYQANTGKGNN